MSRNTVVFKSQMLMGDAIYVSAVIGRYMRENPEDRVIIETLDEYPKEVYSWLPGRPEITFATDTDCDVLVEFDVTDAMHSAVKKDHGIWHGLADTAKISGLYRPQLTADDIPILNIPRVEIPEQWKGAFVICPFSRSCTSHQGQPPNKTLPTATWLPLLRFLRRRGKVLFVGGPDDRMQGFAIDESERIAGLPLVIAANVFKEARCIISVDNGLARISTLVGANTVTLMPEFLPLEVFAPAKWNIGKSRVVQMTSQIPPLAFTASMKHLLRIYAEVL